MKLGVIHHEPIDRALWRALDPLAKLVLIANGDVVIDDDGRPRPHNELLATVVRDVHEAMTAQEAP